MSKKKMIAIAVAVVGAVTLLFADYIAERVALGKAQIREGQRDVDTLDTVLSTNQYTKPFSKSVTGSAQRKIDAGSAEAARYEALSHELRIGGVILIIVGVGAFFFWKKKRS